MMLRTILACLAVMFGPVSMIATAQSTDGERTVTHAAAPAGVSIGKAPGPTTSLLVEVTSHVSGRNAVFLQRLFEIVVTPRDKDMNTTNDTVMVRFTTRFPGEYDRSLPGISDLFSGEVLISGQRSYFLASRNARTLPNDVLQYIRAYTSSIPSISGQTADFEILDHPPAPFKLLSPKNHALGDIISGGSQLDPFTWEKPHPPDPFTDIEVSRIDHRRAGDVLSYSVSFVDSATRYRAVHFPADSSGHAARLTLSGNQFVTIMETLAGKKGITEYGVLWYVTADDGLSTTRNLLPEGAPESDSGFFFFGRKGIIGPVSDAAAALPLSLDQNMPNPFMPSTMIRFSIPKTGQVTLSIYDMLGSLVGTLVDAHFEAGMHSVPFNAAHLPPGTYAYTLQFGEQMLTKRMTVMK